MVKKNILLEEGSRRMRNCHPCLPWDTKVAFLNSLCISMAEAGHSESFRAMVISRVVAKYSKSLENHINGEKIMYRNRLERQTEVEARGGKSTKANWFRSGGVTTTLSVPTTCVGKLAAMVKTGLERCIPPGRTCTKVLEGGVGVYGVCLAGQTLS